MKPLWTACFLLALLALAVRPNGVQAGFQEFLASDPSASSYPRVHSLAPLPTNTPESESPPAPETPRGRPTRTPRPTATPVTLPPPSDPETSNMMIGFGVIAVMVVLMGVWLNRSRTR